MLQKDERKEAGNKRNKRNKKKELRIFIKGGRRAGSPERNMP